MDWFEISDDQMRGLGMDVHERLRFRTKQAEAAASKFALYDTRNPEGPDPLEHTAEPVAAGYDWVCEKCGKENNSPDVSVGGKLICWKCHTVHMVGNINHCYS